MAKKKISERELFGIGYPKSDKYKNKNTGTGNISMMGMMSGLFHELTTDEKTVLKYLKDHPEASQTKIASDTGLSMRHVKSATTDLQFYGYLIRVGNNRVGHWNVVVDTSKL